MLAIGERYTTASNLGSQDVPAFINTAGFCACCSNAAARHNISVACKSPYYYIVSVCYLYLLIIYYY